MLSQVSLKQCHYMEEEKCTANCACFPCKRCKYNENEKEYILYHQIVNE